MEIYRGLSMKSQRDRPGMTRKMNLIMSIHLNTSPGVCKEG